MEEDPQESISEQPLPGRMAEYGTLRDEILRRMEMRNSIVFGTLTFTGALLGFGLETPALALLYPIIAMFLAAAWVQNDTVISNLGRYIRENLEDAQTGLRWETERQKNRLREAQSGKIYPSAIFSSEGVFLITQGMALLIGFANQPRFTILEWGLSAAAVICVLLTIAFFHYSSINNIR